MTAASKPIRHRWFAAVYDRFLSSDAKLMDPIRDIIAGGAKGRVVEIGCGTGHNLSHYDWSQVESVDATEPDIYMLRQAQIRRDALPAELHARLQLQEAPAEALPFNDETFDCAVATLVLCTVADQRQALAELRRVLRPGGQLRLMEHVLAHGIAGKVQRTIQPVYGWMAASCHITRDTEAAVRAAGFELEVMSRASLGPLWPAFVGVATKPA